jgi:uncharacterized protein (TIGR02246 family)
MRRIVFAAFALTVLAACQTESVELSADDVAAIADLRTSYTQALIAGDADGIAVQYADNATEMPPDMPAREGRAAIRAAYENSVAAAFATTSMEIDGRDGLAFDRGTFSMTSVATDTAPAVTIVGKYILIVREQADGSWLWSSTIWNTDAPMPQPE